MTEETPNADLPDLPPDTSAPCVPAADAGAVSQAAAVFDAVIERAVDQLTARLEEWASALSHRAAVIVADRLAHREMPPLQHPSAAPAEGGGQASGDAEPEPDPRLTRVQDLEQELLACQELIERRRVTAKICQDNAAKDEPPGAEYWTGQVASMEEMEAREEERAKEIRAEIGRVGLSESE